MPYSGITLQNLHKGGWGGPPTLPAQRASTSESCMCTSMASCGDPGPCGVKCTGERLPTVALESDRGSSKVRGCSLSIMVTHSRNPCCGSISSSVLLCPCAAPLDSSLGFASLRPSVSSCSSPSGSSPSGLTSSSCVCSSSSSEEESVGPELHDAVHLLGDAWHKNRQCDHCPLLHPAKVIGDPMGGTQSTSSLVGLYARMLPSKMRARATHK